MIVTCRELMPTIRAALERGQRVRLAVTGSSMAPFLRDGDVVELETIHSLPRKGDVILVQWTEDRYVLHRVLQSAGDTIFLRGDAKRQREGPFARRDVLGKVVLSDRDGRRLKLDGGPWRLAGLVWTRYGPLCLRLWSLAGPARPIGKGLLHRLRQASIFRL